MSTIQFTAAANQVLQWAEQAAKQRHQHFVDSEHILAGALNDPTAQQAVRAGGLDPQKLLAALLNELGQERDDPLPSTRGLAKSTIDRIQEAKDFASHMGHKGVDASHLAYSILRTPTPVIQEILAGMPPFVPDVTVDFIKAQTPPAPQGESTSFNQLRKAQRGPVRPPKPSDKTPNILITNAPRTAENPYAPYLIALAIIIGVIYAMLVFPNTAGPVIIVIGGWIISLTLHEFAHALVAYWGGDYTVAAKGYLSLNPLKYTHPLLSIILPLLFLVMGGIGLPGGAVYIEVHRLRSKYWRTAVALAGPFANFLCLIVFSAPFWTGYVQIPDIVRDPAELRLWGAVAFLAWLQITAILFNLIPLPPLDGFNALEPFLPRDLAFQMRSMASFSLLLIILIFWTPDINGFSLARNFFDQVNSIGEVFEIDPRLVGTGFNDFRFWDND
jgi:Zn-dependent protease